MVDNKSAENQLIAIEVKPLDLERAVLMVFFNRGMSVDEMNSLHRWMNEHLVERTHSRPVMNSPADEAEARDRANTAPPQADPDARSRGLTGASSGSEARPVTATELLASENQVVCAVCDGEKPFDEHAAGCPLHPDVRPSKTSDIVADLRRDRRSYEFNIERVTKPSALELAAAGELERLSAVIDATAKHWLVLNMDAPIEWEGGIDAAMETACREIRALRSTIGQLKDERDTWVKGFVREAYPVRPAPETNET